MLRTGMMLGLCLLSFSSFADQCERLEIETYTGKDFHVVSTIVMAEEKAMVVDAQMKISQANKVADIIESKGKDLQAIWVSHAHPDHYLGLSAFVARFPNVKIFATTPVVERIKATGENNIQRFIKDPDISETLVIPRPYDESVVKFGNCLFNIFHFDQGDTTNETVVYLPDSKTLIATDMIYDRTHLWLAENDHAARMRWIENLEAIKKKALDIETVIPGHKPVDAGLSNISVIDSTIAYLYDFDKAMAEGTSVEDLIEKMKTKYPAHGLVDLLETSVKARFKLEHSN